MSTALSSLAISVDQDDACGRVAAGFYRELHSPSAEVLPLCASCDLATAVECSAPNSPVLLLVGQACVATCKAEPKSAGCGAVVFKEKATPGGLGKDCGAGYTCCYLIKG